MIALQPAFLSLLSITVVTASVFQRDGDATTDVTPESFVAEAFDYLVVGGGTAGITVATRLAKGTSFKVGVIEAGAYHPDEPKINIPGLLGAPMVGDPEFDWLHETTPQAGLANGVQELPRGKMLGGTSGMNHMVWNRATTKEYDSWEALGNPGWNWDNLLPFFKKSETVTPAPNSTAPEYLYTINPAFHGSDGPVQASFPKWSTTIVPVVFETLKAWGVPDDHDAGAGANVGSASFLNAVNLKNSTRSYAAAAYYAPCGCSNLVVLTNATVTKINLASEADHNGNFAATGATFSSYNKTYTVTATKEVIVSGGVYNTPQILELSGIGDKDIVSKAGVKSIIDLPGVGANLQDHIQVLLPPLELVDGYLTRDILNDPTQAAAYLAEYNANRTGPYSVSVDAAGYLPFSYFVDEPTRDSLLKGLDAELAAARSTLAPADKVTYPFQRKWLDDNDISPLEFVIYPVFFSLDPTHKPKANASYVTFIISPQHTFSRGTTHISSSDGLAQPVIDPKYLSWEFDKKFMIEGVKYGIKFGTKEPLKSAIAVNPYDDTWTDSFIEAYVTNGTISQFNPVGTSALLPRSKGGVVNPKLFVYGTTNVRVVDASVVPIHITTHISATVYAIAEKAASLILADA